MSMRKKLKMRGIWLLVSFFLVLAVIFMPVFPGQQNGLNYMDNLFNEISKGSSYFIPAVAKDSEKHVGKTITMQVPVSNSEQASQTAAILEANGAEVALGAEQMEVSADMGLLLQKALADADALFNNNGAVVAEKYGVPARQVVYDWWKFFGAAEKSLTRDKQFAEAKVFANASKKALEPAYNYFGVKAESYKDKMGLIIAALAFYVLYTLWYGFGLMWLFEGLGLKIGH